MDLASLATCTRQAASLLNAGGWKTLIQGSISASSASLTVTDAAFVVSDQGKNIAIDRAGPGGTILSTTILTFTDATHVILADTASITVAGATVSYGGRLEDDRRNLEELREEAFEADEYFYLAYLETREHWVRPDLLVLSASILNNGKIPTHVGDIGTPMIQVGPLDAYLPGRRAEFEEIARYRANPANVYGSLAHNVAGSLIGGYYWISESQDVAQYSGSDMKIPLGNYTRGTDLQCPRITTYGIVSRMLTRLLGKEGSRREGAQVFSDHAKETEQAIRANAQEMPVLDAADIERKMA